MDSIDENATPDVEPTPTPEVEAKVEATRNINLNNDRVPILEEPLDSKLLGVQVPNFSARELIEYSDNFLSEVESKQPERLELITKKDPAASEFVPVKVGTDGSGNDIRMVMTKDEATTYYRSLEAFNLLQRGPTTKALESDHWTNMPTVGNNPVMIGAVPGANEKSPSYKLRSHLGHGDSRYVPLYTSGFSLQFSTPGTLDQLFFQTKLASEQINETRDSTGFSMTARSAYLDQAFTDWVLGYVSKSTAGTISVPKLKTLIAFPDLDLLATGIASSIYPKGYNLERQCIPRHVPDPENEKGYTTIGCGHVDKYKLNINRMVIARDDRLSEGQLQQVLKRSGLIDEKTIDAYRRNIRPDVSRIIKVPDTDVVLTLRIPTIYQAERVSTAWLNRLTARTRTLNTGSNVREVRELFLQRANTIGRLMMYGAWIESIGTRANDEDEPEILLTRGEVSTDDDEFLYDMDKDFDTELENFSHNEEQCESVIDQIAKFIADITTYVVVVGRTKCSQCGEGFRGDDTNELSHQDVVTVSAFELFFTLLARKIENSGG